MRSLTVILVWWMAATTTVVAAGGPFPFTIPSPNEGYMALVTPIGKDAKRTSVPYTQDNEKVVEYDFRLEIFDWPKHQVLWTRDFTAQGGAHDQSLTWGLWTKEPQYFVFLTVNTERHRPVEYHLYAFNLQRRCLYLLDPYVGRVVRPKFGVTDPCTAEVSVLDRNRGALDEIPSRGVHVNLEDVLAGKPSF